MKYLLPVILLLSIMLTAQNQITVYRNARIYTVDPKNKWAEALVTQDDKIIFVGSAENAKKFYNESAQVIDIGGKLLMPGFIDNHVHFTAGGFYLNGLDLRGAKSTKEFIELIKIYGEKNPGKWISGGDWDHEAWEIKEMPDKSWIDPVTSGNPVFVIRFDGHMGLANSAALKLAGIDKNTPSPEGGLIVKDPVTGEPTGMLKDNAMNLVFRVIPVPSEEEYLKAALSALAEAKKYGVTSVQDITYGKDLETYKKLEAENKLTCRIFTRMPIDDYKSLVEKKITVGTGSKFLNHGSLKAFADGSLGSSTAWFFEPYVQDKSTTGLPNDIIVDGRLKEWAADADKNRLQLSIHAIGDKANDYILTMYEEISKKNPVWDRRFRMEHAQHVRFEDIPRFKSAGVIASVQPYHCIDDGVWAEKRIGPDRIKSTYPFRTYLDNGVKLCFGTDWTVAPINPLLGIYAAVTRRTLDNLNPDGWIPEQKITVEEAVQCYTINSAYASFEENIKGSLEKNKYADFVVLDQNIFEIKPEKIRDVKVIKTVVGGKTVFEQK